MKGPMTDLTFADRGATWLIPFQHCSRRGVDQEIHPRERANLPKGDRDRPPLRFSAPSSSQSATT